MRARRLACRQRVRRPCSFFLSATACTHLPAHASQHAPGVPLVLCKGPQAMDASHLVSDHQVVRGFGLGRYTSPDAHL